MNRKCLLVAAIACMVASTVRADLIEVGAGVNEARVYVEWSDGFSAEFLVRFGQSETDTTTGLGLMDIIETETELTTAKIRISVGMAFHPFSQALGRRYHRA